MTNLEILLSNTLYFSDVHCHGAQFSVYELVTEIQKRHGLGPDFLDSERYTHALCKDGMKIHDEVTSDMRPLYAWSVTECHESQSLQVIFLQSKKITAL